LSVPIKLITGLQPAPFEQFVRQERNRIFAIGHKLDQPLHAAHLTTVDK
jgi:hypothetical protein